MKFTKYHVLHIIIKSIIFKKCSKFKKNSINDGVTLETVYSYFFD